MWAHEEGRHPEHKAIERSEIGRASPGPVADQQLMLEQGRLSCNPLASGEQERGTIVKRTETFRSGPEGSTPSRQRPASQSEASLAREW